MDKTTNNEADKYKIEGNLLVSKTDLKEGPPFNHKNEKVKYRIKESEFNNAIEEILKDSILIDEIQKSYDHILEMEIDDDPIEECMVPLNPKYHKKICEYFEYYKNSHVNFQHGLITPIGLAVVNHLVELNIIDSHESKIREKLSNYFPFEGDK